MPIICYRNQPQVVLEVSFANPDGTIKTNVSSANVRVYRIASGAEEDVLSQVPLVRVSDTNVYRYIWTPSTIEIGQYHVLFEAIDEDTNQARVSENMVVLNVPSWEEVELLRKVQTGRWKIENNQITFYDDDGVTPLFVFNTFNRRGVPAMANIMERVPVE